MSQEATGYLNSFSVFGDMIEECFLHHLLENFIVNECGHPEIHCKCLSHKIRL